MAETAIHTPTPDHPGAAGTPPAGTPAPRGRLTGRSSRFTGLVVLLTGLAAVIGGGVLLHHGGPPFYAALGVGYVLVGLCLFARRPIAFGLHFLVFAAALAWLVYTEGLHLPAPPAALRPTGLVAAVALLLMVPSGWRGAGAITASAALATGFAALALCAAWIAASFGLLTG